MSDPRADTIRPQPWRAVEDIAKSDAGGWLMEFTARNLIRERDALVADLEAARTAHSETAAAAESEYRDFVRVRAERDVAVERARTLERALEVIAAGPDSFQAQSRYTGTVATVNCEWPAIARAALAEETQ